jgi:hypothetical protein
MNLKLLPVGGGADATALAGRTGVVLASPAPDRGFVVEPTPDGRFAVVERTGEGRKTLGVLHGALAAQGWADALNMTPAPSVKPAGRWTRMAA